MRRMKKLPTFPSSRHERLAQFLRCAPFKKSIPRIAQIQFAELHGISFQPVGHDKRWRCTPSVVCVSLSLLDRLFVNQSSSGARYEFAKPP
jgi:hypothetical protein